jgi:hypothetical protein
VKSKKSETPTARKKVKPSSIKKKSPFQFISDSDEDFV